MATTFGSFDEFSAAMARLYDQTLKHEELIAQNGAAIARLNEAQEATNQQMQGTDARLDRLASMIATLSEPVVRQAQEIESHERRLERMEGQ